MGISSVPADNFIWARTQARGEEYSAVGEMWQERGCAAMGVLWGCDMVPRMKNGRTFAEVWEKPYLCMANSIIP